ncbi:hypothetical protein ACFS07_10795 [Undibacterium arcticum]
MNLTPYEYQTVLRNDLCTFIYRCFVHLNPQTPYAHNWHIELIASYLDACRRGEITRLIITVPPRSMKSICASVAFSGMDIGTRPIVGNYVCQLRTGFVREAGSGLSERGQQRLVQGNLSNTLIQ